MNYRQMAEHAPSTKRMADVGSQTRTKPGFIEYTERTSSTMLTDLPGVVIAGGKSGKLTPHEARGE